MLDKELLDIFGQKIICSVRDQAIFEFEAMVQGKMKSENTVKLNNELKTFDKNQIEILKKVVLTAIDSVIYNTLNMLEQNEENIKLLISQNGKNEKNILDISDSLSGELVTKKGWIEKFSKYK
ncbi:hypothetical protein A9G28_05335 [Gilliamella sp. Fer1-1]|uniref:hypothetical protein n=1 Tax=unclassified Gilliamella TaxID=2685620 RepID=UPI00080DB66E|nr:hypothetical protein [Gilliamella apicola]OCG17702.1 hypothetical protein A9G47_08020 [Gilliamella apicola]OCG27725.1 hypothetical protein A9G45_08280 [Gilliamella apicola]OCG29845.1 hypothetical protein A9G46_12725 [Gilliamella apicola]OCG42558.1 hypothetical protein A9G28_05335 [Gilliamella apicola]OCG59906.1 hypothetical protein A9G30_11150 [Gilliamella apicola]